MARFVGQGTEVGRKAKTLWILSCRVSKIVGQIFYVYTNVKLYNTSQICPRSFYENGHLKSHLVRYSIHKYIYTLFIFVMCSSLCILVLYPDLYGYRVLHVLYVLYVLFILYPYISVQSTNTIDYMAINRNSSDSVPRKPCACPFCPLVSFIPLRVRITVLLEIQN